MSYFPTDRRQWAATAANAAQRPAAPEPAASVGHVALVVRDLARSVTFYREVLGLTVTGRLGDAAVFLAFGGYHHHLALTTAEHPDGEAPTARAAGLHHVAFKVPSRAALAAAARRLRVHGVPIDDAADHGFNQAIYLRDPDGHRVEVYADRDPAAWPRDASGALRLNQVPLDLNHLLVELERAEPGSTTAKRRAGREATDDAD